MNEPQQILVRAASDVMRGYGLALRERGWLVELVVDYIPALQTYAVSLRLELPAIPGPVEAEKHGIPAEATR